VVLTVKAAVQVYGVEAEIALAPTFPDPQLKQEVQPVEAVELQPMQ